MLPCIAFTELQFCWFLHVCILVILGELRRLSEPAIWATPFWPRPLIICQPREGLLERFFATLHSSEADPSTQLRPEPSPALGAGVLAKHFLLAKSWPPALLEGSDRPGELRDLKNRRASLNCVPRSQGKLNYIPFPSQDKQSLVWPYGSAYPGHVWTWHRDQEKNHEHTSLSQRIIPSHSNELLWSRPFAGLVFPLGPHSTYRHKSLRSFRPWCRQSENP